MTTNAFNKGFNDNFNFNFKKNFRLGCWNIRTLLEAGRLKQVIKEMMAYKLKILGVSEVRWNGFGEVKSDSEVSFLYSGRNDEHREGVGLLITKDVRKSLITWDPVSERIITARFKTNTKHLTIVQCYAPTEVSDLENKQKFYADLHKVFDKIKKRDIVILMGDFNAKVGNSNEGLEQVMGKHGLGEMNVNGELFTDFCVSRDLVIGGTIFKHKDCHKVTWVSPDQKTKNQIDHIAVSRLWRKSVNDIRNKRGADVGTDHHLLIGQFQIKLMSFGKRKYLSRKIYDLNAFKDENRKKEFSIELKNRFELLQKENEGNNLEIEDIWNNTKTMFTETSEKILGYKNNQKKDWITNETWNKIEERKNIKNKLNSSRTRAKKQELQVKYNEANKDIKKRVRQDKRKYIEEIAARAEEASKRHDTRELYKITNSLSGKKIYRDCPIKSKNGSLITNETEQLKRWQEYFGEMLNPDIINDRSDGEEINNIDKEVDPVTNRYINCKLDAPTKSEIITALKQIKNGKSAGIDNIPPEILKADIDVTADILHPLIKQIWEKEYLPSDWNKGLIVKIPKKRNLSECDNWRGITLLSIPSKILSRIIYNRIVQEADKLIRKEQAGFRTNRSCVDQINTLRIICEQCNEWRSTLYLLFIDFEKAFDSLNRDYIWRTITKFGIPGKISRLIKLMYENYTCNVIHKGILTENITTTCGVKQGCILSPIIFLIIMNDIMQRSVSNVRRGIRWGLNDTLEDLDFADDICLLSHSLDDIQNKVNTLSEVIKGAHMKINVKKTKEMRLNSKKTDKITIDNNNIETVQEFKYLGSIIDKDCGAFEDVKSRIKNANSAFVQLYPVWKSRPSPLPYVGHELRRSNF